MTPWSPTKRIYLASSWQNIYYQQILSELRFHFEVYDFKNPASGKTGFAWPEAGGVNPNGSDIPTYIAGLGHPIAVAGFALAKQAMDDADTCVLLLPSGRSAHSEAGYMKGQGKRVAVLLYPEKDLYAGASVVTPELMYRLYDLVTDSCHYLKQYLQIGPLPYIVSDVPIHAWRKS